MPTETELIAIIRRDAAFDDSTVFTDASLRTQLNEGALDMARKGDAFIKSATWNAVADAQEYVISGASPKITGFLSVYWELGGFLYTDESSISIPMKDKMRSESWLNLEIPGWQDIAASDTLIHAYLGFDSSGNHVLGVYPKSKTTTPSFKAWYRSRGTDMSSGSHYPWTGSTTNLVHTEPFQKGCALYALWKLHDEKTHMTDEADRYEKAYIVNLAELKDSQKMVFRAEAEGLYEDGRIVSGGGDFGGMI